MAVHDAARADEANSRKLLRNQWRLFRCAYWHSAWI